MQQWILCDGDDGSLWILKSRKEAMELAVEYSGPNPDQWQREKISRWVCGKWWIQAATHAFV